MEQLACNTFQSYHPLLLHISPSTVLPAALHGESSVESHQQVFSLSASSSRPSSSGSISVRRKLNSLGSVKQLHAQIVKSPKERNSDTMVRDLIRAYLKFHDFTSSAVVFLTIEPGCFAYESFLEEYEGFGGDPHQIVEVFRVLYGKGVEFNSWACILVLKLCTLIMDAWLGLELHACLVKRGFDLDTANVKIALIDFYKKCWNVETVEKVMPTQRTPFRKERIAAANIQNSNPKQAPFEETEVPSLEKPDVVTVIKALQACGKNSAINEGKKIHGYVVRHYLERDIGICNSLISMYSKNTQIALARRVFDLMGELSSLSTWNSMISGYASLGYFDDAWNLVGRMNKSRFVKPDEVTWNSLLINYFRHGAYQQVLTILGIMVSVNIKPCSRAINPAIQAATTLNLIDKGRELHCYAVRTGLDCDEYAGAILVDMYIKSNSLNKAKSVFGQLSNKDIVTWNSMINGYASKGLFDEATKLVDRMKEEGIRPDIYTHNSLLSGYAVNGLVEEASSVLHQMEEGSGLIPSVVSWTGIISGCSKSGKYVEAFKFFNHMLEKGVKPKPATMLSLLQSCAGLSLLQTGKEIHCMCTRNGFIETNTVATAIMDMYIKSGSLDTALKIFWRMKEKTVGTWNCMIMGLALHSRGHKAIELFEKMQLEAGLKPDAVTFTAILSSCKNSGLIDMGWKFFDSMNSKYSITPTIEHYSCMVDLLGRSGYLDEAWDFIQKMPVKPEASTWGSFLRSCVTHNNLQLGEFAAQELFKLEPTKSTNYVLLMNLFSKAEKWQEVERLQEALTARGLKILRSWSWVQLDRKKGHLQVFYEDETHPDEGEVYFELYQLISELKKMGYVPDTKCVYQNLSDAEKEKILMNHPEKLAITYGLIKKGSGSGPIRVVKSSRMCGDCHSAAKFVSLVRNCEILLKDGVRVHHFKEGECSCNDYW